MLTKPIQSVHIIDHMGYGGAQEMLRILHKKNPIVIIEIRKKEVLQKFSPISFFSVYKQIKNIYPPIIHIHLQKSLWCIFFGKIFFPEIFTHTKIIFHEHGTVLEKNFWYSKLMRFSHQYIDAYISPTQSTKNVLIQNKINPEKIHIISNFIEKPCKSLKRKKNEKKIRIGYL